MFLKLINLFLRKARLELIQISNISSLRNEISRLQSSIKDSINFDYGDSSITELKAPRKAEGVEMEARFREIISDPLNLLINRVPNSGVVSNGEITLHNGNKVPLKGIGSYYGELFGRILVYNRGVHEPLEEFVFQELIASLEERPVMIELGCYWAHYSMWLKKVRPYADVYLVEPDKENIKSGLHNFKNNGFEGQFINEFVGTGQWEVDKFLSDKNLSKITILHSDIQGFEVQMLKSATESLKAFKIDYVIVSTHSSKLHDDVECILRDFGYLIEVKSDFLYETTSHDGLIFAVSPLAKSIFDEFVHFGRTRIASSKDLDFVDAAIGAIRSSRNRKLD